MKSLSELAEAAIANGWPPDEVAKIATKAVGPVPTVAANLNIREGSSQSSQVVNSLFKRGI